MSEIDESESALRENINRKGTNSYYYAHGNTANGPAWDGKEQPRLLAVATVEKSATKTFATPFDSFSWLDEKKSVKVYIDFENADQVEEESISLVRFMLQSQQFLASRLNYDAILQVTSSDSLEFTLVHSQKTFCLNLSPLNSDIESASFKKKSDKFVISMKKATEAGWDKLKK